MEGQSPPDVVRGTPDDPIPHAPPTAVRGGVWNRHLPYAASLPAEAAHNLEAIQRGLADAVASRKLNPGARYWCGRLTDHLLLYQYELSATQHTDLIVLLFKIFSVDGLDETLQERTATALRRLLKKRDLLPSTSVVVAWRPLYDVLVKHFFGKLRRTSEVHRGLGDAVVKLIKDCRRFFSPEATAEIFDELSPLLCPHDEVCFRAAGFFSLLLPTDGNSPAAASPAFMCWFDQLFDVWSWVANTPDWDFAFVQLYARVARDNLGLRKLGWSTRLPWLFNKFLSMLALPVGTRQQASPHNYGMPWNVLLLLPGGRSRIAKVAVLIVYMMEPGNDVFSYLERLLESTKAFFHPSNTGRWSPTLAAFMLSLCEVFAMRAREERAVASTIPEAVRLSDADWQRFVGLLQPYVVPIMYIKIVEFSKSPAMVASAAWALRHLSYLAPGLVLPPTMKRVYPALETVTETHQAYAALSTLAAVARPLLWAENYTGGAKHLVPLLQLTLPGIDPNDGNKTQVTLQFLMVLFMNVYLVDCSQAVPDDATPEEREILLSTSFFEDWAAQLFDRIFCVLETLVAPSKTKRHTTEGSLCEWIALICHGFFQQVSPPIFNAVLDKVFTWVTSSMILHLGKTAGKIISAAADANPEATLKRVMPFLTDRVTALLESHVAVDEVDEDTDAPLDDELEWYLHILARIVIRTGAALLPYKSELLVILDRGLRLKAPKAAKLCGKLLRHTLKSLTCTYVRESCTLTSAERATWEADPVGLFRRWGNSPDVMSTEALSVEWHVASEPELAFADELMTLFYRPAVASLAKFASSGGDDADGNSKSFRRDALINDLVVVRNCIRVGLPLFPELADDAADLYTADAPSFMTRLKIELDVLPQAFVDKHSGNRPELMRVTHDLVARLLATCEDDTKLFKITVKIAYQLLCVRGTSATKHGRQAKVWSWLKQGSADLVRPGKRYSRAMLLRRVDMQLQRRKNKGRVCIPYTAEFRVLLEDMMKLGASRYAVVRKRAQAVISHVAVTHPVARHDVFARAISLLVIEPTKEEMEAKHHQIKGALFMLCCKAVARLVMQHPRYAKQLASQLLVLEGNDRPSVQTQINHLFGYLSQENRSTSLEVNISPEVFSAARVVFPPIGDRAAHFEGDGLVEAGATAAKLRSELLECQLDLGKLLVANTKGWKFEVLVAGLLASQIREKADVPDAVAGYFAHGLVSDSLKLRQLSVRATSLILAVSKGHPRKELFSFNADGSVVAVADAQAPVRSEAVPRPWSARSTIDKYPHCFEGDPHARPTSKEAYESVVFVDKNYLGWSIFPQRTRTYPPLAEQPAMEPNTTMHVIWDIISREGFLEKFCTFFSQDKSDGTAARFSDTQAELYKGLSRNHRLDFLKLARPEIERLFAPCETDKVGETTAKFRCAAELVAGIVRGSKHWSHSEVQQMWAFVIPTLEAVVARVEHHTVGDFASMLRYCVYDRDPRRFYPLTDLFFRSVSLAMDEGDTSFAQYRHLELFVSISEELSWRGTDAGMALFERICPVAAHPYKLVREKMARCMAVVFRSRLAPGRVGPDDAVVPFVTEAAATISAARGLPEGDERRKGAVLLAKTLLKWATIVFYEGFDAVAVWHLPTLLAPIMTAPELSAEDDELSGLSHQALSFIAQAKMTSQSLTERVLEAVFALARDESWHVRERALLFIQVFFFRNLFFENAGSLTDCIMRSLEDPQVEVRDVASTTLSGMVRCGLVGDELLSRCVALSDTRIRKAKRRRSGSSASEPDAPLSEEEKRAIVLRHAGILGVQAYIAGYPYEIPAWLPNVLLSLAPKVADPEPLKASVKKTLGEFWRTHQDDRQALRDAFDDDQYATLRDLVVGYEYYA